MVKHDQVVRRESENGNLTDEATDRYREEIRRQRNACVQIGTGHESAPIAALATPMRTLNAKVELRGGPECVRRC